MPRVLFEAAGALRADYRAVDWAATPLGPVESWSTTLRTAVDTTLSTRFPVALFWGRDHVMVYNEAFVPLIGNKHPAALGAPAAAVFPEAWPTIGPMMAGVLAGEGATWVQDAPVPLVRSGFLEECHFTFSYSPIRDAEGRVEGVMDIAAETTAEVIGRRRLDLLGRLGDALGQLERAEDIRDRALPILRADVQDFAAVDLRLPGAGEGLPDTGGRKVWLPADDAVLVVRLSPHLAPDEDYLGFLRLVAAALGQALQHGRALEAERGFSETLQRSLLTPPLAPDDLEVAVRYIPAAQQAQVGGDWYDSFQLPDGALAFVIGDVAGHDQHAAAAMAQVRNLLRGVSYALRKPPAAVLCALDEAMDGLGVEPFATAVLGRIEQHDAGRLLRWSNAGHPPPVLLEPDGTARLLDPPPDPLLGMRATERADHAVALEPGSSVVFYTDGLVERRGVSLTRRLAWLRDLLQGRQGLDAQALCDLLVGALDAREDDVALMVLRVAG